MHPISFPNLNLTFNINPIAISIFGINIYWYGIIIVIGVLLGLYLAKKDDGLHGIKYSDVIDFVTIAVFVGILFARGYYVLFKLDYYISHPSEIIKIWNGGLAIYGGIIGGVLTCIFFCRKRKIKFLNMADYIVPFLVLGQSIGRWGNFVSVHPTFLYESLLDFIIFIILMKIRKNRKFEGQLVYLYFIIYGMGRAIIEGLRTDSLMLCGFRVSQFLSLFLAILSSLMYMFAEKCRRKNT